MKLFYVQELECCAYVYDSYGPFSDLELAEKSIVHRHHESIIIGYTNTSFKEVQKMDCQVRFDMALEIYHSDEWEGHIGDRYFIIIEIDTDNLDKEVTP